MVTSTNHWLEANPIRKKVQTRLKKMPMVPATPGRHLGDLKDRKAHPNLLPGHSASG